MDAKPRCETVVACTLPVWLRGVTTRQSPLLRLASARWFQRDTARCGEVRPSMGLGTALDCIEHSKDNMSRSEYKAPYACAQRTGCSKETILRKGKRHGFHAM